MTAFKLVLENVTFEREYQTLFSHMNGTLTTHQLWLIQGANGSGKTTLLRILAGFIEPSDGQIFWQNKSIFLQREFYQKQIQYLGHLDGSKKYLTVSENLQLNCALAGVKMNTSQFKKILEEVGLGHVIHSKALHLSAGQLRRLSLARLLLKPVSLWILDEPTTALDKDGQSLLCSLLERHLDSGGMAIIATHQPLNISQNQQVIQLEKSYV